MIYRRDPSIGQLQDEADRAIGPAGAPEAIDHAEPLYGLAGRSLRSHRPTLGPGSIVVAPYMHEDAPFVEDDRAVVRT
jgi:hypothetical protein